MSSGFGFWNHNIDLIQDPFEGCIYYDCNAFQTEIIRQNATVWPLDDMNLTATVPADGILRKLGNLIPANYVTDGSSWNASWAPAGDAAIDTLTVSDNIGYCRDNFLYLAKRNTGAWLSSVDEHPSNVDEAGNTQTDVGAYIVREFSTGQSTVIYAADYFVYTFNGVGDPQQAAPLTLTINIDDETGSYLITMDGKTKSGTITQDLVGGFWVHAKYSRTFGSISGTQLPYTMVCELYINGVLEDTLTESFQRANIKNTEPYGVAAAYAANDVPGFAVPSQLYIANGNIAAADLYTGTGMDVSALKTEWERNFFTYYPGDECFTSGCRPYKCAAFEEAILASGPATLFPLNDADTETTIPADGILNRLGTPLLVDGVALELAVEVSSRGLDWLDPGANAVGARAIGGDLTSQTCSTYGTYFRTGVWASAINNTPTPSEMNSFGGYIWNLHTGAYSGLFNVAYGIEWSFTGQTTRRIEFINFGVSIADKATNTVRVNYDNVFWEGVVDTAIVDMAADESFWWHLDVDLTMGTPSAGAVPLTSTWTLYINGQAIHSQAGYTRNFVNLNTSQPVFFRSYNGDGSLPGYVIPSRIILPHDELHALNYYIGKDLDVDIISQGWERNFTTYTVPPECV